MALLGLLLLFIVVPLAELYVIFKVGDAIGWPWAILILAVDSIVGTVLLRTQGRAVWRRFNETLNSGRMPHREVMDGVLVIFGGAFLITPGFITDLLGLPLLIPPTRGVIRRIVTKRLGQRVAVGVTEHAGRRFDVEGSATEYEPPPRHLQR